MAVTWKKLAYVDDVVLKSLFDAYSILAADTDNIPAALTVGASTIVGRKATGGIVALSASEARTILNVADGATANAKASGAELDTGTDDTKFATAKAINDSHNVPSVAPGTSGNVLTSDGTDWTSSAPGAPASHALSAHTVATANLLFGGYQAQDQVIQTVADDAAVSGYATPVVGKILWSTATLSAWICTSSV
jgi:hypothetical protein